jgi:phosphatidate phosphatase APP1
MFPFRVTRRRRTTLAPQEVVEFYPSYGYRAAEAWRVVVQGCVFNPHLPWFRRRPVMAMIRRAMRVDRAADEFFRRRMQRFLLDPAAGRQIAVRIAGDLFSAGESGLAGLFRQEIDVPGEVIARATEAKNGSQAWITYAAQLAAGDERQFAGRVQLIAANGVSIVSDVDDTIKHSNVPNRRDLFHNTFARKFSPIDGMADLYRECERLGAVFHFVSGSPWQLYVPLSEFLREHGFPEGTFHLKPFRIRDTARKIRGPTPQVAYKRTALEPILNAFPERKFVLIGDSGEQDAQIYGGFLRERPHQITAVFIRSLHESPEDSDRLQRAFDGCPADRWRLYQSPAEIREPLLGLARQSL